MPHSFLEVEDLVKRFPSPDGDGVLTVFDHVSLRIEEGEFVCIIGHSGCGKSTILNILAGLDEPSDGVVIMNGKELRGAGLDRGVVFQNYSLLPWRSALGNVRFAVQSRWPGMPRQAATAHAYEYLEMVGLTGGPEHRKPAQLSGGMRQRVSLARAFAIEPSMLLMDEPFGALDALTRGTIQEELLKIWNRTNKTVFMITHDVDEAILLSDRILLMTNGPHARIAESVKVDIARPRDRITIIHEPGYYAVRNHLVDFLVKRSKELAEGYETDGDNQSDWSLKWPRDINPAKDNGGPARFMRLGAATQGPDRKVAP